MGLNELIDELQRNINALEQSYEIQEKGDVATRIKEKIEEKRAILNAEKAYSKEIKENATRMLELKRMYQEITVIQRELDKDISSERRQNLLSRLNEIVGIARDRYGLEIAEGAGIEGATEGIKKIIKKTEFTINRLNGSFEDSEIDEDREELNQAFEEIDSNNKELADLQEENKKIDEDIKQAEKLKELVKQASYTKALIADMEKAQNKNSAEYLNLVDEMKKQQREIDDLMASINMTIMGMFGEPWKLEPGENTIDISQIDAFVSKAKKEKADRLEKQKVYVEDNKKWQKTINDIFEKYDMREMKEIVSETGTLDNKKLASLSKDAFEVAVQKINDEHEKYIKYRRNGYAMNKVKGEINGTHTGKGQPTSKDKPTPQNTPTPKGAPDKNSKPAPDRNTTPIGGTIGQSKNKTNQNLNPSFEARNTREEHEEAKENLPAKKQGLFSRLFSKDKSIDEIQEVYERPQSMEVFLMQNDDKINARDGKMSFFDVEGDKLVRKERDLSYYTKNPSKALNKSIDGIRERMIKLYGKEGLKQICKDMKKDGKDTEFTKIMSGSIIKSGVASFRFRGRDEIDGKSKDSQSEIIRNQIKVAMALDSAMTPEEVCDILKSPEKAYSNHDADLGYITVKGRFPFSSPKPMEYKKSTLEQMYEGKTEPKLGIEIKFDENGRLNVSFDDDKNKNKNQQRDVNKGQDRD